MKIFGMTVGLAALLAAASANAAPNGLVYDTITGQTILAGVSPKVGNNHGPLGDSFTVSTAEEITNLTFTIKDALPNSSAVLIYLVPNSAVGNPTLPSTSTGTTLSSATLLGQILDSSMATTFGSLTIPVHQTVTPGTWWIEMVDASSSANGNGNANVTAAQWGDVADTSSLGVPSSGNIASWSNTTDTALAAFTAGDVFGLQITTPEPASLALLGVGMMGLGYIRRRKAKKTND